MLEVLGIDKRLELGDPLCTEVQDQRRDVTPFSRRRTLQVRFEDEAGESWVEHQTLHEKL